MRGFMLRAIHARVGRLEKDLQAQHDQLDIAALLRERFARRRRGEPDPPPPTEAECEGAPSAIVGDRAPSALGWLWPVRKINTSVLDTRRDHARRGPR